jgi:hypothetical protein
MTVSDQEFDDFLDFLDELDSLNLQEAEVEQRTEAYLAAQDNGSEILEEYLSAFLARPKPIQKLMDSGMTEQDAIATYTQDNGLPQNPTNPS